MSRPTGRKRTYGSGTGSVNRRGSGLGTGPVGNIGGSPLGGGGSHGGSGSSGGPLRGFGGGGGCGRCLIPVVVLIIILVAGGSSLFGGLGSLFSDTGEETSSQYGNDSYSDGSESGSGSQQYTYSGGSSGSAVNTTVASGARDKYTVLKGGGQDTATVLVYMCGADLESRSGMATRDLQEMCKASTDNINLIVFTGGAKKWNNSVIDADTTQIYQVTGGGLKCLESDLGDRTMTDPATLAGFIKYGAAKFPADRYELIFWDHGGGSVSGYGYDERHASAGSMNLAGINTALSKGGIKFDFIGFDACLMATMENALMLNSYADYLIASEETEPGYGWYYTNWVNMLNDNTSVETTTLGKQIVDDFVDVSAQQASGQSTTLSLIDLAELSATAPEKFSAFSKSISTMIKEENYQTVSSARSNVREFARSSSSSIDQVDLIDLARRIGNTEGQELATVLSGAVKYNRTSRNMTNANGISIYFPYRNVRMVDSAVNTYEDIGMDDEYARCIQEFANLEVSGQVAAGGSQTASPLPSLFGDLTGYGSSYGTSYGSGSAGEEIIGSLLGSFLSGGYGSISGLSGDNTGFLSGRSLSEQDAVSYIADHHLSTEDFVWTQNTDGQYVMSLTEDQWDLVNDLAQNVFYDDGSGYVDLGLDNAFEYDEDGNLIGNTDGTWLSIDGQIVAYYYLDSTGEGDEMITTGRVPALLDGERVNFMIVFDPEHPEGYIAGATTVYNDGQTDTQPKTLTELTEGDTIQYLCDYYTYDGTYSDTYTLSGELTVDDDMPIRNITLPGRKRVTYRFSDIYDQQYWTPAIDEVD